MPSSSHNQQPFWLYVGGNLPSMHQVSYNVSLPMCILCGLKRFKLEEIANFYTFNLITKYEQHVCEKLWQLIHSFENIIMSLNRSLGDANEVYK